jgi:D-threo-aldose 1-dehydrogenase
MAISPVALGRGGISTSNLSFGGAVIGNLFTEVSDEQAEQALSVSYEAGIRYFDTAPHYGLGLSEQRMGRFLQGIDRASVTISTKVGRLIRPNPTYSGGQDDQGFAVSAQLHREVDYSYDATMRSLEESLERLQVDYVDMVLVHDPDEHETAALEGAFPALDKLRAEGVIRSYGAGMNQSAMLARFVEKTDLDVVMLAGRFSLLEQPALEDLLPVAQSKGISVVAAGVFNSGILAREYPEDGAHYNYEVAPEIILDRARELARACVEHGYTLPQVAAQFPLTHPAIAVVCLGARNADQARRNAALFDETVPGDFYQDFMERGLLGKGSVGY